MENRVKCLLIGALVFVSLGFLFYVIGFSTGHWLESDDRFVTQSRFVRLGLWEACFNQWTYYKDYTGKTYNGCWWIFSYEYRPIWQWLNPTWLLAVQVVMTINLILSLVCLILLILYIIQCCPGRKSPKGLIILAAMLITSGVLEGICTLTFGAKSVIDRTWLENPDQNYLSWSFGMIVMAAFLTLFAGMCTLVAGMQVYLEKKYYQNPKPYSGYVIDGPPPNY